MSALNNDLLRYFRNYLRSNGALPCFVGMVDLMIEHPDICFIDDDHEIIKNIFKECYDEQKR